MVPLGPPSGSFDWLVSVFKGHRAWRDIDPKTRRLYEQGLSLAANYVLKDGSRVGSKQIANFTRAFVDGLYAKFSLSKNATRKAMWFLANEDGLPTRR